MFTENDSLVTRKAYTYVICTLINFTVNSFIYYCYLIIETIQLISYTYNCIHKFMDETSDVAEIFSKATTYFRVLYLIT